MNQTNDLDNKEMHNRGKYCVVPIAVISEKYRGKVNFRQVILNNIEKHKHKNPEMEYVIWQRPDKKRSGDMWYGIRLKDDKFIRLNKEGL